MNPKLRILLTLSHIVRAQLATHCLTIAAFLVHTVFLRQESFTLGVRALDILGKPKHGWYGHSIVEVGDSSLLGSVVAQAACVE